MIGQGGFVPLGFFHWTVSSHEHQAQKCGHHEDADHDEHEVHVEARGSFVPAAALDLLGWAVGSWVIARKVVVRLKGHQVLFKRSCIGAVCGRNLFFESGDVCDEVCDVPFKQGIVHFLRCRKRFGGQPLDGIGRLVFLAGGVNCTYAHADVVHVTHAVDAGETSVSVRGWDVHFLGPSGAGARHVEVVLPEAIAGSGEFVAQRPRHRNHVEGGCGVGQEERSGWGLCFVGVCHVDVHVAGTVVSLCHVKRKGVKDIDADFVAVRSVAIGR